MIIIIALILVSTCSLIVVVVVQSLSRANGDQKKAGVVILIEDKIDFELKAVKRDKEGHYIMIKGSIQEEDICTQHRSITICKANANKYESGN